MTPPLPYPAIVLALTQIQRNPSINSTLIFRFCVSL